MLAEDGVDTRQTELDEVRARIQHLREELAGVVTKKESQEQGLQVIEIQIGNMTRLIRDLEQERDLREQRLADLQRQRTEGEAMLTAQRDRLGREVRASYVMGRQERLKLMLNQEDPALLSRMLAYLGYFQHQRVTRIDEAMNVIKRLRETERSILEEQGRLAQTLEQQDAARSRLEVIQVERKELLVVLDADIRRRGEEVSRLEQDEARLTALVERLKREAAASEQIRPEADARASAGPFSEQRGLLVWPVEGRLKAGFGSAKGAGLTWDGVLLNASVGSSVHAIHRGRVVFADWLKGYGLMMIVDHGDGYMSLYGYNQSLFKETGEWVEAGDVLAAVGNSGGRAEPALYFGIRFQGKPQDPTRWCRGPAGNRVGFHSHGLRGINDVA